MNRLKGGDEHHTTRKLGPNHYTLPLKSNLSGMRFVPFHHTLIIVKGSVTMPNFYHLNGMGLMPLHYIMVVMEGNMTMPPFLLLKWNGICAIIEREHDNASFFTT